MLKTKGKCLMVFNPFLIDKLLILMSTRLLVATLRYLYETSFAVGLPQCLESTRMTLRMNLGLRYLVKHLYTDYSLRIHHDNQIHTS